MYNYKIKTSSFNILTPRATATSKIVPGILDDYQTWQSKEQIEQLQEWYNIQIIQLLISTPSPTSSPPRSAKSSALLSAVASGAEPLQLPAQPEPLTHFHFQNVFRVSTQSRGCHGCCRMTAPATGSCCAPTGQGRSGGARRRCRWSWSWTGWWRMCSGWRRAEETSGRSKCYERSRPCSLYLNKVKISPKWT